MDYREHLRYDLPERRKEERRAPVLPGRRAIRRSHLLLALAIACAALGGGIVGAVLGGANAAQLTRSEP